MREFRNKQGRSGERFWTVGIENETSVCTIWGAIKTNGTKKVHGQTVDEPGPKGKEGTKAYVTAEENAVFCMNRSIREKEEEGYQEVGVDGRPLVGGSLDKLELDLDLNELLPKQLCFSKPTNGVSLEKANDMGDFIFTKKMNGMMIIAHVMLNGETHLYSRRMDNMSGHFPHLLAAMKQLKIPAGSILLFEGFMGNGANKRDLISCSEIMRSDTDKANQKQMTNGWMHFYLFRIPFWKGVHLEEKKTHNQLITLIENTFTDMFLDYRDPHGLTNEQFLHAIQVFEGTPQEAVDIALSEDFEGWVCYQSEEGFGDKSFSYNGKPTRPPSCFKLKPIKEDDFIGYYNPDKGTEERPMGKRGSGKNKNRLGSISLYQIGREGLEVYICEVGTGLSDEQRDALTDLGQEPVVVHIQYDDRSYVSMGDKTNALFLPRVIGIRTDKTVDECENTDLIEQ